MLMTAGDVYQAQETVCGLPLMPVNEPSMSTNEMMAIFVLLAIPW
jgi:hypothetical protein